MTSSNCSAAPSAVLVEEEPPRLETIGSRPPHPTARAFFQALDSKNLQNLSTKQTKTTPREECHDDENLPNQSEQNPKQPMASPASSVDIQHQHTTSSSWIQKRIQTLGWRNRYSQADQYPIHLMDAQFFFSVRQVQRGEVDGTYGTGATVWPASLVLLYYLQHLHQQQQKQHGNSNQLWMNSVDTYQNNHDDDLVIVELGAGTGVVSIGAALLYGQQVQPEGATTPSSSTTLSKTPSNQKGSTTTIICTDGCDAVVQLARDNIQQAAQQLQVRLLESQQEQQEQNSNDETNVAQQQQDHYIDKNPNPSKNSDSPSSLADPDQTQTTVENQISYQSHDPNSIVATIQGCPMIVKQYWWGTKPLPTETTATILPVLSAHSSTASSSANTAAYASSLATNETTMSSHRDDSVPPTISPRTLVLVSDCVLPKLYPIAPLVDALDQLLLHPQRDVAYISYEHRYYPEYDPRDKFRELCHIKGLQVTVVPIEEQHPIYSVEEDIELWKVRRL